MRTSRIRASAIFVILAAALTTGCTTVREGLVGQEYAYLMPFAEQTVSSMGIERIDFRENEFTYLRQIIDADSPEVESLQNLLGMVDDFRDRIVYYSVEVVRVGETAGTEEERVQDFADALIDMQGMFSLQLDIEPAEFASIEADIRSQPTFLEALRATQPLIDRAGEQFENLVMEIEQQALPMVFEKLDSDIESHYALVLDYNQVLIGRRDEFMTGLSLVRESRMGDSTAVTPLQNLSIVSSHGVDVPSNPSTADLDRIESFFLAQMAMDDQVVDYLALDIDGYINAHAELERETAEVIDGLNVARLQVLAWSRAHLAMANGAKEPGRWLKVALDAASAMKRARSSL